MPSRCPTCIEAEEQGYLEIAHCDDCHRSWSALEEEHCTECHHHFSSDRAFLDHRRAGACLDPSKVKDRRSRPKLRAVRRQYGLTWVRNDERPFPQKPVRSVGSRTGATNGRSRSLGHLQGAGAT